MCVVWLTIKARYLFRIDVPFSIQVGIDDLSFHNALDDSFFSLSFVPANKHKSVKSQFKIKFKRNGRFGV